jgi:hypothetical protein
VSKFCRENSTSGGSCVFTRNIIQTKEVIVNLVVQVVKKNFELSVTELPDLGIIMACIYRSPNNDFDKFLSKLEILITKVHSKGKQLILCDDLNVNFLQHSGKLQDLKSLLLMSNLANIVKSPTRVTSHTETLTDVIIVNNKNDEKFTATLNVGYSDHLAQVLHMKMKKLPKAPITTYNRHFTENNIAEFKYLLHKETWDKVLEPEEPNTATNLFINTFSNYFNTAFPLKVICVGSTITNMWITKCLITSGNKLRLLCNMKRTTNLLEKSLKYIKKYQLIFRKVVKEAKKKEADRYVMSAKNKNMALWKLINKEFGNSQQKCNIIINDWENIITNPQIV